MERLERHGWDDYSAQLRNAAAGEVDDPLTEGTHNSPADEFDGIAERAVIAIARGSVPCLAAVCALAGDHDRPCMFPRALEERYQ